MRILNLFFFGLIITLWASVGAAMAQGFGEYGRALGGATQRQGGIALPQPAVPQSGKGVSGGIGDIGGARLPSRLIVIGNNAPLFPRQDDQAEKITSLSTGEVLVPLLEGIGGSAWYMVKTANGVIGWVKSTDVRQQP